MSNIDPILPYLKNLRSLPRLSSKELTEHIALYKLTQSTTLRNIIVTNYLPLIPQLIMKYHPTKGVEIEDLLSVANTKLIEVISLLPHTDIIDLRGFIITSINNCMLNMLKRFNKI